MAAGLGAVTVAGALAEAHAFRLVRHDVTLPGPADWCCRILHVSDTHYRRGQKDLARFLASLGDVPADLVVMTGDMVANDDAYGEFLDAVAGLLRRPGVFVTGSNDVFAPRPVNPFAYLVRTPGNARPQGRRLHWHTLIDALAGAGWACVNNTAVRLPLAGGVVEVRGANDAHVRWDDYGLAARHLPPAAAPVPLVLGVTHSPYRRVLDAMAGDGVGLALAGHTHGGQVCLPWHGAVVSNCDLPPAMAKGLHRWDGPGGRGMSLHVTAGLGTSPTFPLRLFCRPEACLLDVRVTADAGQQS